MVKAKHIEIEREHPTKKSVYLLHAIIDIYVFESRIPL